MIVLSTRSFASRTTNTISQSMDLWRGGTGAEAVPAKADAEGKRVYTKLFDLQRITGYSWTRIAELMSCSRQSIHNWQRGEALSERSIRDIARMHDALSFIDRGSQVETKDVLEKDEGQVFKLLKGLDFENAKSLAGPGTAQDDMFWKGIVNERPGRQDHWTDRLDAISDEPLPNDGFPTRKVTGHMRMRKKKG